jgi:hypothetical protein
MAMLPIDFFAWSVTEPLQLADSFICGSFARFYQHTDGKSADINI